MNTLIQRQHNHIESGPGTQKVEIQLANGESGFAFFRLALIQIFVSEVGNVFGVMLRKKDIGNEILLKKLITYTL